MSENIAPPIPALVPETAPFSEEQRAWLNGFFAGLVSLDGAGVTALSPEQNAALMPGGAKNEFGDTDDGEAPWHDQTMLIADRMKLAEARPLRRKMMAAMAQQDCGQCGYNCEDYSNLIVMKKEERLNLCVPGGKETSRMLKSLYEELGKAPAPPAAKAKLVERGGRWRRRHCADRRALARQSGDRDVPRAHAPQPAGLREGHLAYRHRSRRLGHRLQGRRLVRCLPSERAAACRRGDRRARRAGGFPGGRTLAARGADRRRVAFARTRCTLPALFVSHRRRAASEGEGAADRRGPGRRCRNARRARRDGKIRRRAPRSGSLHRSARSVAAAALFDFLVAEEQPGPCVAHDRHRALQDRQARPPRRRVDVPRRARPARHRAEDLRAEGARLRSSRRHATCRSS